MNLNYFNDQELEQELAKRRENRLRDNVREGLAEAAAELEADRKTVDTATPTQLAKLVDKWGWPRVKPDQEAHG